MPLVNIKYDLKKDAWSWVSIAKGKRSAWGINWRSQVSFIPDDLLSKILKSNYHQAQLLVENHLRTNPKKIFRESVIKNEIISLGNVWRKIENKYFKVLSNITNKPIYRNKFTCFITTGFMCPYNLKENWFMASMWHSLPFSITTICHELLHLQFLYYFQDYLEKNGLNNKQIGNLKESLTFLLNEPEFAKIILVQDQGYPQHIDLRKKLRNIWLKNKNFQRFLEKSIKVVNNKH